MGRIAAVENIFDTLADAGLDQEHECFEDLVWGCLALAMDAKAEDQDLVQVLAKWDQARSEEEILIDLADYRRACAPSVHLEQVIAEAVAAGRAGWAGKGADAT